MAEAFKQVEEEVRKQALHAPKENVVENAVGGMFRHGDRQC